GRVRGGLRVGPLDRGWPARRGASRRGVLLPHPGRLVHRHAQDASAKVTTGLPSFSAGGSSRASAAAPVSLDHGGTMNPATPPALAPVTLRTLPEYSPTTYVDFAQPENRA